MKKRFILILALAASTFVILLWTHQTVVGQNGVLLTNSRDGLVNDLQRWCPFNSGRGFDSLNPMQLKDDP
jgi:hypothetical protein